METDTLAPDMIDADTAGRRAPRQLGHHISGGVATADADAAKRGNNSAKQVASDARLRNTLKAKSGSFNCARKNRRSDVPAASAFTRRASGARGPEHGPSHHLMRILSCLLI